MDLRLILSICALAMAVLAPTPHVAADNPVSYREIRAAIATGDRDAIAGCHAEQLIPTDPQGSGRATLDGLLGYMELNDTAFPETYYEFLQAHGLGFPDQPSPGGTGEAYVHACDRLNRLYYARGELDLRAPDATLLATIQERFGEPSGEAHGADLLATAATWLHSRRITLERRTGRRMTPDAWAVLRHCLDRVTRNAETTAEELYFTIDFIGFVSHRPAWIIQHPEAWAFFRGYLDDLLAMEDIIDPKVATKAMFLLFGDAGDITGDVRGFSYRQFQGFYAQSPVIRYDDEYGIIRDYDLVGEILNALQARGATLDAVNGRGETIAQSFMARGRETEARFVSEIANRSR